MSVLYSKLRLEVPSALNGQNATITSAGGATRTVQMSSPVTDVMVAGMETYRVQGGDTDESVGIGYGEMKNVSILYVPANLEDASWSLIQQLISDDVFADHYNVGDTKTFQINNKTYTAEVVAINDGTGSAGSWYPANTVDFICKELYETTYRCNVKGYNQWRDYGNNAFGFTGWEIRSTLNNTIYPKLPSDLKDVITAKSHSYQSGAVIANGTTSGIWSSLMVTTSNNLWLPTYYEIIGSTNSTAPGEGSSNNKHYILASKIKKVHGETSANKWWLASPSTTNSSPFYCWCIDTGGYADGTTQSMGTYGVPICFRIG